MVSKIEFIRLGLIPYAEALRIQNDRRAAVECGEAPETVYLLEHPPVITLGRKWHPENLLHTPGEYARMGIEVCETDRGGDVTYHGPGQMVAYPVLKLDEQGDLRDERDQKEEEACEAIRPTRRPSIQWYLRALEQVLIRQLECYGLSATRREGFTGVWVGDAKIAAIGVRLHNWTTSHGIALNVNPDMSHFRLIIPCGIADKPVTSLQALMGKNTPSIDAVMEDFRISFTQVF